MLHPSPRHAILLIFKVRKLGLRKVWTHVYPVSSKHISAGPGVGVHPAHPVSRRPGPQRLSQPCPLVSSQPFLQPEGPRQVVLLRVRKTGSRS